MTARTDHDRDHADFAAHAGDTDPLFLSPDWITAPEPVSTWCVAAALVLTIASGLVTAGLIVWVLASLGVRP